GGGSGRVGQRAGEGQARRAGRGAASPRRRPTSGWGKGRARLPYRRRRGRRGGDESTRRRRVAQTPSASRSASARGRPAAMIFIAAWRTSYPTRRIVTVRAS